MWNSPGSVGTDLMPMVFDAMLGLPHVDWAGVEGAPVTNQVAPAKVRHKSRRHG
jgi:beta-lactamase class C